VIKPFFDATQYIKYAASYKRSLLDTHSPILIDRRAHGKGFKENLFITKDDGFL